MRQQQLLDQYHFQCGCPACSQGPCSAADARLVGLRCSGCAGPVVPSIACNAGASSLQALPAQLAGTGRCFQCVPPDATVCLLKLSLNKEWPGNGAAPEVPIVDND